VTEEEGGDEGERMRREEEDTSLPVNVP